MQCIRLGHYFKLNPSGTVSGCGHMSMAPEFSSISALENSDWLKNIKKLFVNDQWPSECVRCQETEKLNNTSVRIYSNRQYQPNEIKDFLIIGGVIDNICNSACLTCDHQHSTKIGSLTSKNYIAIDNSQLFWNLPVDRITYLEINGGEPSASKNYRDILKNLPKNVKGIRINTNCGLIIEEIDYLVNKGIDVTVTASLDGIGTVHDYIRWPIPWKKFYKNLMHYRENPNIKLNTWTTVSALNINDFDNIKKFVREYDIDHAYALLKDPYELDVRYTNHLTETAKDVLPGFIAVDRNNQQELDSFLTKENALRSITL